MDHKNPTKVHVLVPPEIYTILKQRSERTGIPIAFMIRTALVRWVRTLPSDPEEDGE